jgi:G3E family GTPase
MRRLHTLNPSAPILKAPFGDVDRMLLFRTNPMDSVGKHLGEAQEATILSPAQSMSPNETTHAADTHSISLTFRHPLEWRAFGIWLSMLLHARGEEVLRVKGLLDIGEKGPIVLNGVQHIIHPPEHLDHWPSEDHSSRLIFITRSLQPQAILTSLRVFQEVLGARGDTIEEN